MLGTYHSSLFVYTVYTCNPQQSFSHFTLKSHKILYEKRKKNHFLFHAECVLNCKLFVHVLYAYTYTLSINVGWLLVTAI